MKKINDRNVIYFLEGKSCVELQPDHHVFFSYVDGGEFFEYLEPEYRFDLLSFVGNVWRDEIDRIIEHYGIKFAKLDTPSEYCDIWLSYNVLAE